MVRAITCRIRRAALREYSKIDEINPDNQCLVIVLLQFEIL